MSYEHRHLRPSRVPWFKAARDRVLHGFAHTCTIVGNRELATRITPFDVIYDALQGFLDDENDFGLCYLGDITADDPNDPAFTIELADGRRFRIAVTALERLS